jgi:hypothetical protein
LVRSDQKDRQDAAKKRYDDIKRRTGERSRKVGAAGRDIGSIPPVKDAKRRDACRSDFRLFCETYGAESFPLAWSADHLTAIAKIEAAVLRGELFAFAMPRGSGKSTLSIWACLWACLYGHRSFVMLVGSDQAIACQMLDTLKSHLEQNDLLAEDFPAACYPVRALEGITARVRGQTCEGEPTHMGWTADKVTMPWIGKAASAGAAVRVAGITGRIRGVSHTRPDGKTIRPDLCLIDDPQTDESSASPSQVATRERILAGAILGLSGPGKKIAGLATITVIRPDDLADRLLDRMRHPSWQGERTKLVYEWPTADELWGQYAEMRREGQRSGEGTGAADAFYASQQAVMDAGSRVAWPERKHDDELTAIQHAWNLRIDRGESAFMAEYQNAPLADDISSEKLDKRSLAARALTLPRGTVPLSHQTLTAFIDVQDKLLYWLVASWGESFGGHVVAYGTYPDQASTFFEAKNAKKTLAIASKGAGFEGALSAGLESLTQILLGRDWLREDDVAMRVRQVCVDANWGQSTEVVRTFCRRSTFTGSLLPTHGKGIGASGGSLTEKKGRGEKLGLNWVMRQTATNQRYGVYETNFWKTFSAARLRLTLGDPEAITLHAGEHDMLVEHLTSEYPVRTEAKGRVVDEWKLDNRRENHWWDCYDAKTHVLTQQGWKPFADVLQSDRLATVDISTDRIEYESPTRLISRHYRGQMIQIGGKAHSRVDLCVTPEHRMVVYDGQKSRGPVIKSAVDLSVWDKIKTRSTWQGDGVSSVSIPSTDRSPAVVVNATDLASFLGWYVAEGSCQVNERARGKTHVTIISQNAGPKQELIRQVASRLPWTFHAHKTGVVFSNKQVYDIVSGLGNKYTKRVPQWIKDASPNVIAAFVESAVNGDGWRDRDHEAYATVSPLLAGDMAELYLKLGYGCSVTIRPPKPYLIRGVSGGNTVEQHHVHRSDARWGLLRNASNTPNFRRVEYDGMVYCASVPNGTLVVRRNGKIAVCGNCLVGSAVAASIAGVHPVATEAGGRQRKKVTIPTDASGKRVIQVKRLGK